MSKFLQRVITAVVLLALLLVIFFRLPRAAAVAAVGAFVIAAAWEWAGFAGPATLAGRFAYALATAGLMVAATLWFSQPPLATAVIVAGLAWWCAAAWLLRRQPAALRRGITAACGWLVLLPAWVAAVLLLREPANGHLLLLYLLAMVWAADIGAYFVGRRIGRVKLAPRVSPGKTWEGAIGGLAAAAAVAALGGSWLGRPLLAMVPVGLSIGLISILGDLTVSYFKRAAGLKDSGNLFPGHGGVLDRIDSVASALPLFTLQASWLGLVAH